MAAKHRWRQLIGSVATTLNLSSLWWQASTSSSQSGTVFDFAGHPSKAELKRTLLTHAHGNVLELAAGMVCHQPYNSHSLTPSAGKTFSTVKLYSPAVSRVTLIDSNLKNNASASAVTEDIVCPDKRVSRIEMDAHRLNFPDNSFTTIVDMYGLCCYVDPHRALEEMWRVADKTNPDTVILLLEHGSLTSSAAVNYKLISAVYRKNYKQSSK